MKLIFLALHCCALDSVLFLAFISLHDAKNAYHFNIQTMVVLSGSESQKLVRAVQWLLYSPTLRLLLFFLRQLKVEGGYDVSRVVECLLLLQRKMIHTATHSETRRISVLTYTYGSLLNVYLIGASICEPTQREAVLHPGPLASLPLLWQPWLAEGPPEIWSLSGAPSLPLLPLWEYKRLQLCMIRTQLTPKWFFTCQHRHLEKKMQL